MTLLFTLVAPVLATTGDFIGAGLSLVLAVAFHIAGQQPPVDIGD